MHWFQANTSVKKGKKATYFHLFFKPLYRFFSSYISEARFYGWRSALRTFASVNAYGVFSRYAKMILIQKGLK